MVSYGGIKKGWKITCTINDYYDHDEQGTAGASY